MKYLIINLSPRKKGTSKMLTSYFADRIKSDANSIDICDLYSYLKDMDNLLDKTKSSDCIILIGPCYVGSFPADTIYLLESMSNKKDVLHGQSLYGFIQGGMPYTHTHEHGVRLLELFCENNNVKFKGGFVMGDGATLDGRPLEKIVGAKKLVPAVNNFIENIKNQEDSYEILYKNAEMKIPGFITKILAATMTKNLKKSFTNKGIDYNAQSPYLRTESKSINNQKGQARNI